MATAQSITTSLASGRSLRRWPMAQLKSVRRLVLLFLMLGCCREAVAETFMAPRYDWTVILNSGEYGLQGVYEFDLGSNRGEWTASTLICFGHITVPVPIAFPLFVTLGLAIPILLAIMFSAFLRRRRRRALAG